MVHLLRPAFAQKQESALTLSTQLSAKTHTGTPAFNFHLDSAATPPVHLLPPFPLSSGSNLGIYSRSPSTVVAQTPTKMAVPPRHQRHLSSGSATAYSSSLASHAPKAVLRRQLQPHARIPVPVRTDLLTRDKDQKPAFRTSPNLTSPTFALSPLASHSPHQQSAELSANSSTFLPTLNLLGQTGGPINFSPSHPRRPSTSYSVATGTDQSSPSLMSQDFTLSPELSKVNTRARHGAVPGRSGRSLNAIDTGIFHDFHPSTVTPELVSHFGGIEALTGLGHGTISPLTPSTPKFAMAQFDLNTPSWAGIMGGGDQPMGALSSQPSCQSADNHNFVDMENDILSGSPDSWPISLGSEHLSLGSEQVNNVPTTLSSNFQLNPAEPQSTLLSGPPLNRTEINSWLSAPNGPGNDLALTDDSLLGIFTSAETQPQPDQNAGINPAAMMMAPEPIFEQTFLQSQNTAGQVNQANSMPAETINPGSTTMFPAGTHSRHQSDPEFGSRDLSDFYAFPTDIETTPDFKQPDDILDYSFPPTPAHESAGLPENMRYGLSQPVVPFEPSHLSAEMRMRTGPMQFNFPGRGEATTETTSQSQSQTQEQEQSQAQDSAAAAVPHTHDGGDCTGHHHQAEAEARTEALPAAQTGPQTVAARTGPTVAIPDDLDNIEGYSCPVHLCGMMFLTNEDYIQHLDVNHGTTIANLPEFLTKYGIDKASIKLRNSDPNKGPSVCWICDSRFGRRYDLTRHLATVHATKQSPWSCYYCDPPTVLSRSDAQQRHMSTAHPHLADALNKLVMKRKKGKGRGRRKGSPRK